MTSSASTPSAEPADYGVLRWLVAATFVVILNETLLNNAIPRLTAAFKVTPVDAQWLATAFMLTMAVVIPVTGWFLQRVTTRQAFALAMGTFFLGTVIAAIAPTFWVLVVARVVQASGTAVMMPLLMTTLMTVVPMHDRGRVMGNVMLAISVAPALGPTASGLILKWMSWRWLFLFVLPIAGGIAVAALRRLRDIPVEPAGKLDALSIPLSALGFGAFVYGVSKLQDTDRTWAWIDMAVGAVFIVLFVLRQLQLQRAERQPLLDLRTLQHRTFTLGLVTMSVAFAAFMGVMILLPFYLQQVLQISIFGLGPILSTGLLMMPGGLAMGLLGPRVGKAFDNYGGRVLVIPGSIAVITGMAILSTVTEHTSPWLVLGAHVTLMIGLAGVFTPLFTLALGAVPQPLYSHASSLLGALQQVGGAFGAAILITVMTAQNTSLAHAGHSPVSAFVGGLRAAFLVGLGLAVLTALIALLMPNRLPEDAMGHHGMEMGEGPFGTVEEFVEV